MQGLVARSVVAAEELAAVREPELAAELVRRQALEPGLVAALVRRQAPAPEPGLELVPVRSTQVLVREQAAVAPVVVLARSSPEAVLVQLWAAVVVPVSAQALEPARAAEPVRSTQVLVREQAVVAPVLALALAPVPSGAVQRQPERMLGLRSELRRGQLRLSNDAWS